MKVDLKDYTDVKSRIALFYADYPNGRLVTDRVEIWQDVEPARVVVKALAYRSPDDPLPGVGWSWLLLPGNSNFTRGSEIENAETSAWGRAIGSLGIGIGTSIASTDEIDAKREDGDEPPPSSDGSLIGLVGKGAMSPVDMSLRADPGGRMFTGFVLLQRRQRLQVVAVSPLAEQLQPFLEGLLDQRVSVWGTVELVPWKKGGKEKPPYRRLQLTRIQTDDWIMPPAEAVPPLPLFDDQTA